MFERQPNLRWVGKYESSLILISCCLISGLISIHLGQDINWDQKNYHIYNVYAFLEDRLAYDFAPAQLQTFHNPLLHLPIYGLIHTLSPPLVGFILGGFQGVNVFLVYLIAKAAFCPNLKLIQRNFLITLVTIVGAYSPIFCSELGTTFGDNLTSLPILAGLLLIIHLQKHLKIHPWTSVLYFLVGLLLGSATGLKLTNATYAIAMMITCALISPKFQKISRLIQITLGIIVGTLTCSGFWMIRMYELYQNPLFPYYNAWFKSPYLGLVNFKDTRWIPQNIIAGLSYPFSWAIGAHPSLELAFRDIRWAIAVIISGLIMLGLLLNRFKPLRSTTSQPLVQASAKQILLVFGSSSFLIWLLQFGYSRYLIPLELMSGVYLVCLIDSLLVLQTFGERAKRITTKLILTATLLAAILLTVQIPNWGRNPWQESWLGVETIPADLQPESMILLPTSEPTSYVIPAFPKSIRFVRLEGNLFQNPDLFRNHLMEARLQSLIQSTSGPIYALYPSSTHVSDLVFKPFNLTLDLADCDRIRTNLEEFSLCAVKRSKPHA
jgi:hypothetical protein